MKVLVVAAASGGHIFPAAGFITALKDKGKDIETLLLLPQRSLEAGIRLSGFDIKYISTPRLSAKLDPANLLAGCLFMRGVWESLRAVIAFKPDIVVGFGGIDSVPCIFFAWLFRIKTLLHEQNVLPGRANRFLARFVDRVAVSFGETKKYLNINPDRIIVTGNPLRSGLKKIDRAVALGFFGLNKDKLTLLVMGGSQGSQRINAGFIKAVSLLEDSAGLQVIHIAGTAAFNQIKQAYEKMKIEARVFGFFDSMEQAYSAADLCISRAGATTIAELVYFRLPAIISAYPYAYAHQVENAGILEKKGCAIVINDAALEQEIFGQTIEKLINDPAKIEEMRKGFKEVYVPDAAGLLADAALSLK